MATSMMRPWTVEAVNLPDHADNPIHTDAGARAAGFPGALVAGITVYAYLTHVPASASGAAWVGGGGGEVRFLSPIFDGDTVACELADVDLVEARVAGEVRASLRVWQSAEPAMPRRRGDALEPMEVTLGDEWTTYAGRIGDAIGLYGDGAVVHPAVWPSLANDVFRRQLVTGAWIHLRSRIQHHDTASVGSVAVVESTVVERFTTRRGERAVVDVVVSVAGRPVASLEHEAYVSLTG